MLQTFLHKLKEEGKIVVLPGKDNDADLFTKTLDSPDFEKFAQVYVGLDKYEPDTWSQEDFGR